MIYICIPAYNEERTIGVLLWKLRQVMTEFPRDYEVLVVDDASTDATSEVLEPYTRILPLTVHRNAERQGYAASLETAIREAVRRSPYPRRDAIVTLQADFTEAPDEVPALIKRIEGGADVVTSAVHARSDDAPRSIRWTRAALGFLLRRAKWPEEISDPLSGFRAYRVIALKRLLDERNGRPLVEWDGWAANVALLRAVIPFARRVEETPVEVAYHRRNRASRLNPWQTGREIIRLMRASGDEGELGAKVRRGRRRGRAPAGEEGGEERTPTRKRRAEGEARGGRRRREDARDGRRRRDDARGERRRRDEGPGEARRREDSRGEGRDEMRGESHQREETRAEGGGERRSRPRRDGERRPRRREAPAALEGAAEAATEGAAQNGEEADRPRRRRRRGGRRRGGRRTGAPASGKEGNGTSRETTAEDS